MLRIGTKNYILTPFNVALVGRNDLQIGHSNLQRIIWPSPHKQLQMKEGFTNSTKENKEGYNI